MFRNLQINKTVPVIHFLWLWIIFDFFVSIIIFIYYDSHISINSFVEASKFFFIVSGAGFVAFTSYCQWNTSLINLNFLQTNQEIEKKKVALQFLGKWDSDQFKEKRKFYRNTRKIINNLTKNELIEKIENDSKHRNALLDIANFFEDVEQSINFDIADEQLLEHGFKPLVISIKETYEAWFLHLKSTDQKYYNQYGPFFNLLEKWK